MVASRFACGRKVGGKYTLVRELGAGGMSDVWLAKNGATGADVALKVARGCADDDVLAEELRQRFRNEARACAKLGHRNIVRVFDLIEDEPDGALILVMERLYGSTLASYLAMRGHIEPKVAVAIVCGVLAGLAHAHGAGIVHRDIKPENVFLALEPDGLVTPMLLDFGIAKFPRTGDSLTSAGRVLGTPQYMSPEQIRSTELDARSDLFALGAVLYEMLSGVSPFEGSSTSASLAAVLEREPVSIPDLPPRLAAVLARMLAKDRDERPASALALLAELRDAVGLADAELAGVLLNLVAPDGADSRKTLESVRGVVFRPIGEQPKALDSERTLDEVMMTTGQAPSDVPAAARARRGWVYLATIASLAFVISLAGACFGTQHTLVASAAPLPSPNAGEGRLERTAPTARGTEALAQRTRVSPHDTWAETQPASSASPPPPLGRDEVALTPGF